MTKDERDRLNRYGDLLVNFANGENTDRILIDYLENQKIAFNISYNPKEEFLKRFPTLEKMAEDYPRVLEFHNRIKELQEMLRNILLQISENRNVFETKLFKYFLLRYNGIPQKRTISVDDTKLIEIENPFIGFEDPLFWFFLISSG